MLAATVRVDVVGEIDRRGLFAGAGHRDVAECARGVHRMAPRESRDVTRLARLIRAHPEVGERMSLGLLGVARARLLAAAFAHPRAGGKLAVFLPMSIDAAEIDAALQPFLDAEYERDRAWLLEHHGPNAAESLMPRTAAQRRYDAMLAAIVGPSGSDTVVNLVATPDMLAAGLTDLFPEQTHPVLPAPVPGQSRCGTITGDPLPPADVALAAIRGRVRFVLTDQRRVVIQMGHRVRLFRGAARDAVLLQATRCTQPGCLVRHTHADHLTSASERGPTHVTNGGPRCGCHNRTRHRLCASSHLDPDGRWVTRLPDGTDIAPPDDHDLH